MGTNHLEFNGVFFFNLFSCSFCFRTNCTRQWKTTRIKVVNFFNYFIKILNSCFDGIGLVSLKEPKLMGFFGNFTKDCSPIYQIGTKDNEPVYRVSEELAFSKWFIYWENTWIDKPILLKNFFFVL